MNVSPTTPVTALSIALLETALLRNRTAVCVRIDSFDPDECSATVTPLVNEERIIEGETVSIPSMSIPGCPVIFPTGSGRGLTFGLSRGDLALGLYRHRSHDEIDGGAVGPLDPQSSRRLREADIVVLAGYHQPATARDSSTYRTDGQPTMPLPLLEALHIGASTATYTLVRSDLLASFLSSLVTWANTHTHAGVMPGPGSTAIAAPPLGSPGTIESLAVKVDR